MTVIDELPPLQARVADRLARVCVASGGVGLEDLARGHSRAAVGRALRALERRELAWPVPDARPPRWVPAYALAFPRLAYDDMLAALERRLERGWRVFVTEDYEPSFNPGHTRKFAIAGRPRAIERASDGESAEVVWDFGVRLRLERRAPAAEHNRPDGALASSNRMQIFAIVFEPPGGWPPEPPEEPDDRALAYAAAS